MLVIITLAAIVFLLMNIDVVASLFLYCIVGGIGLALLCIAATVVFFWNCSPVGGKP